VEKTLSAPVVAAVADLRERHAAARFAARRHDDLMETAETG
jgi:hypothetical protein